MSIVFRKPPLVEILAEIRWDVGATQISVGSGESLQIVSKHPPEDQTHYFELARSLAAVGYNRVLRVGPMEVPHLPIYRFRSEKKPTLYQVGSGMFSANSTPPYKSWNEFAPFARQGFELLLRTRRKQEAELPFTQVTLRYIDAFTKRLTGGMKAREFMREILGFGFSIPEKVIELAPSIEDIDSNLQFRFTTGSHAVSITCATGKSEGEEAIIWDTEISNLLPVHPHISDLMSVLGTAHEFIHDVFVESTTKLHGLMEVEHEAE